MCTVGLYVSLCLMIFLCPFLHCKALRTAMYKRYINAIIIIIIINLKKNGCMHNTIFYLGGDCSTSWWPWAFLRCFSRSERLSRFARRPWRRMALKIRPRPHLSGYFLKQEIFLRFSLPSTRERRSFKNGPWSGDFKKRRLLVYVWTDANGGFRIRWCYTL